MSLGRHSPLTLGLSRRQAPELGEPDPCPHPIPIAGDGSGGICSSGQSLASLLGCSTSLEALKSLLSTTGHWHDFAHLELQSAWEYFTSIHTYPQAVGLLARY